MNAAVHVEMFPSRLTAVAVLGIKMELDVSSLFVNIAASVALGPIKLTGRVFSEK